MLHSNKDKRIKSTAPLLGRALVLALVLIFIGCQSEPPPKAASKVVRKKIGEAASTGPQLKPAVAPAKADAKAPVVTASVKPAGAPGPPVKPAAPHPSPAPVQQVEPATAQPADVEKEKPSGIAITAEQPAQNPQEKAEPSSSSAPVIPSPASQSGETQPDPEQAAASSVEGAASEGTAPAQATALARRPPTIVIDPFEPLFKDEAPIASKAKTPHKKRRLPQTPLERIDLGQLKLTAIFRSPSGSKALVEEASGKGYIIEEGTWIGVHAGQVEQITDEAVVVEEEIENAIGEISLTQREMKLQKPPGE